LKGSAHGWNLYGTSKYRRHKSGFLLRVGCSRAA
jgi:hypothetical protein